MTDPSLEDADIKSNGVKKWRWSLIEWVNSRFTNDNE